MSKTHTYGYQMMIGAVAVVAASMALSATAMAQGKLPRTILLGTQQPGSLQHSMATGIAKIATAGIGTPVVVRPHAGSSTHIPLLAKGELDLSVAPAIDTGMSFQGRERISLDGRNTYPRAPGLRVVMSGSTLLAGLVVQKKSPIRSAKDLRGKKVAGEFPSGLGAYINMLVHLKGANMGWKDVQVVPFGGLNDSLNALVQGRIDATVYGIGAPRIREADSRVGVRFITDDCSPEGKARILGSVPGYRTVNLKKGRLPAVVEDICVTAFVVNLLASIHTSDAIVTAVLKAIWEGNDKLRKLHPGLRTWKNETAVDKIPTAPYHKAAVAFFKKVGAWTADAEANNKKLMELAK